MDGTTWAGLLALLTRRRDLSADQARWAIVETVRGDAPPAALAGFLAALRTKGETAEELSGVVTALVDNALPVSAPQPCVDIAGTGGDGTGAMNVSTLAGIVAAGAGARVVKHGGRAASSATAGSADLVEALGIPLGTTPDEASERAARFSFSYLFAPTFNPGLRHSVEVRRGLGVPTVFNLAAPLVNPARPARQVVGVADAARAATVAAAVQQLGRTGLVVRGDDGLDKLTTTTTSRIWIVRPDTIDAVTLDPVTLGLGPATLDQLRGGAAADNAVRARTMLAGEPSPLRDVVVLNAAAVLLAASLTADDVEDQFRTATAQAAAAIDSGRAARCLADLGASRRNLAEARSAAGQRVNSGTRPGR